MKHISESKKLQTQVYLSEYQAMMAKINWFMSLQIAWWAILVAFFGFLANAASAKHEM